MFDLGALLLLVVGFLAACVLLLGALLQAGVTLVLVPAKMALSALGALFGVSLPAALVILGGGLALGAGLVTLLLPTAVTGVWRARPARRVRG